MPGQPLGISYAGLAQAVAVGDIEASVRRRRPIHMSARAYAGLSLGVRLWQVGIVGTGLQGQGLVGTEAQVRGTAYQGATQGQRLALQHSHFCVALVSMQVKRFSCLLLTHELLDPLLTTTACIVTSRHSSPASVGVHVNPNDRVPIHHLINLS
jgi:hypothetical protein